MNEPNENTDSEKLKPVLNKDKNKIRYVPVIDMTLFAVSLVVPYTAYSSGTSGTNKILALFFFLFLYWATFYDSYFITFQKDTLRLIPLNLFSSSHYIKIEQITKVISEANFTVHNSFPIRPQKYIVKYTNERGKQDVRFSIRNSNRERQLLAVLKEKI